MIVEPRKNETDRADPGEEIGAPVLIRSLAHHITACQNNPTVSGANPWNSRRSTPDLLTLSVFGLCHLLGFRFAPRLRDLSERRLYVVDRRANHGVLDCLIGGAINLRRIEENWDEALRMTASIRAGTVAPSVLMRRSSSLSPAECPGQGAARDWLSRMDPLHPRLDLRSCRDRTFETSATVPLALTSRSPPSSSGAPSTSVTPLPSFAPKTRRCPINCSLTLPRSAGSTSASMATTSGHPNRSSRGFGRCEIRAPPSSMLLSVVARVDFRRRALSVRNVFGKELGDKE